MKQKLLGVVVTALVVNFFAVALEWTGGSDILVYGAAIAAVILAVGVYSSVLSRLHGPAAHVEPETTDVNAHP